MSNYQIFHNPQCSKSRAALALLEEKGIDAEVVLYLKEDFSTEQIKALLTKLNLSARDIMRTGEEAYKNLNLANPELSEDALIQALAENPRLIERPIVIKGDKAVVGRPIENVAELIG